MMIRQKRLLQGQPVVASSSSHMSSQFFLSETLCLEPPCSFLCFPFGNSHHCFAMAAPPSQRPCSSQNKTPAPSRKSSRIITPMKNTSMIPTAPDSRFSLNHDKSPSASITCKKRRRVEASEPESQTEDGSSSSSESDAYESAESAGKGKKKKLSNNKKKPMKKKKKTQESTREECPGPPVSL